jgi:hypothetical protein
MTVVKGSAGVSRISTGFPSLSLNSGSM